MAIYLRIFPHITRHNTCLSSMPHVWSKCFFMVFLHGFLRLCFAFLQFCSHIHTHAKSARRRRATTDAPSAPHTPRVNTAGQRRRSKSNTEHETENRRGEKAKVAEVKRVPFFLGVRWLQCCPIAQYCARATLFSQISTRNAWRVYVILLDLMLRHYEEASAFLSILRAWTLASSVAFGGSACPAPISPYPRWGGITIFLFSPSHMPMSPWSKPLMTCPRPSVKVNASSRRKWGGAPSSLGRTDRSRATVIRLSVMALVSHLPAGASVTPTRSLACFLAAAVDATARRSKKRRRMWW